MQIAHIMDIVTGDRQEPEGDKILILTTYGITMAHRIGSI